MKCRHLYLDPSRLQEFCEKNQVGEQIDSFEGTLLDGFIAGFPGGYIAFYPHYLNCWSSDYYVEYGYGNARNVWYNWDKCKAQLESESETDEAI